MTPEIFIKWAGAGFLCLLLLSVGISALREAWKD